MKTTMILTTDRLYMRPLTTKDTDAVHHLWTLPEVRRHLWNDQIITRDTVEAQVKTSLSSFDSTGWGLWAICLKSDPYRVIGFCGLRPAADASLEFVIGIDPEFWRMGLASEGGRKILDYSFRQLQVMEVFAYVPASLTGVAAFVQGLGLEPAKRAKTDHNVFHLTSTAFFQQDRD